MAGLTQNGLVVRTQPEIQAALEAQLAAAFPGANVRAGPWQQIIGVVSEELAQAWETLGAVYSNTYPDGAVGLLLDQLMALTGSKRRAATRSRVAVTVNLDAGATLRAGARSIAAVSGNPDAQFYLEADVTNSGGSPANVAAVFVGSVTGPIAAPAGTLTVIVTPVAGWNSITNAADAELGRDVASDVEARAQRLIELAGGGASTLGALRAAVARVTGVEQVETFENVTMDTDSDGRPAKSFETVLWDGSPAAAADNDIAQAIWDTKPAGIYARGATSSGTATDADGLAHTVAFTRATKLRLYVEVDVVLKPGTDAGWSDQVKAAIVARGALYVVGEDAYASQLSCVVQDVPGILAVTAVRIGLAPSPVGSTVAAAYNEIIRISSADVTPAAP